MKHMLYSDDITEWREARIGINTQAKVGPIPAL